MIDLESVRRQLDLERRTLAQEGESLEALPHISRIEAADGSRHMISFSALSSETADEAIAEQAAHYRALRAEVEWKVYEHDGPPDLRERLEQHGFEVGEREAVLVLDLRDRRAWLDEPASRHVRRVESPQDVDLYRHAAQEIFEKNYDSTASELLSAIRRGSTQHRGYMAIEGDAVASIGRLYTQPKSVFGGLYGGGTRKPYRGRGLYRATVAARARDAAQSGARYLMVDALPSSRPILERLGFVRLTDTWPYVLTL